MRITLAPISFLRGRGSGRSLYSSIGGRYLPGMFHPLPVLSCSLVAALLRRCRGIDSGREEPNRSQEVGIDHLTMLDESPPDQVSVAREAIRLARCSRLRLGVRRSGFSRAR
jgi:hypothetical protein